MIEKVELEKDSSADLGARSPKSESAQADARMRRLARTMMQSVVEYGLIAAGDHIMVAVSGGKDSYTLLDLLLRAQKRAPFRFELTAVHLDQRQPGYNGAPLRQWLEAHGGRFEIIEEDTYSEVVERTPAGKAYCAICSRLRRGILYTAAQRLGCNKIALGHHRDDALETLLLNLVYGGRLQAMPASYRTDDGRFEVIRPLIECAESEIAAHARDANYPILPCNLCGSQEKLQRDEMARVLVELEARNPRVRSSMLAALKNVRPSHLLDRKVAEVWRDRPESPEDEESTSSTQRLITLGRPPAKPGLSG
jgi:tRNA 2-thiocytidine biosynthesis protein TtcA